MSDSLWDGLAWVEQDLLVCAQEAWGILPYACSGPDDRGEPASDEDIAAALLGLVDRGWVEVCRLEPWTSPNGESGIQYGPPIPREVLERLLRLPETWDDPVDQSWVGALTLSRTERWYAAVREQRAVEG
ncbi:hypothetical protein [Streptomyces sp. NPDC002758]